MTVDAEGTQSPYSLKTPPGGSSLSTGGVVYRPTKPQFGDVVEVGPNMWAAWTGGKPKGDWSGLMEPSPRTLTPNQYRMSSISSQAKALHYRTQGLETKFTRDGDLLTFQKKFMKHLVSYGMDTITYIQDPTDKSEVLSVVTDHALFNIKDGVTMGNLYQKEKFDRYDLDNVRDAKELLLKSIDHELETQLYENCTEEDSFVAYWLNLIHIVRSVSVDRFDKIKDRIKARNINDYPGQSVELIVTDFLTDWRELHGAGMYDQNLTLSMLNTIMEAGGTANEDFRFPLRDLKQKLNTKLLEIRHLNYSDAHRSMVADELDVQSITKAAKAEYRQLYDDKKWPAANHAKDSKAMNKNYGSVNKAETAELKRMVNALIQSAGSGGRDKSKDTCNHCGEVGHWASSCPKKKQGRGKQFNSGQKSARNNPGKRGQRGGGFSSPRTPPPKNGESEIKFINGKKSYWCAKCNRWTLSHGTENHKTKEELKGQPTPSAGMARINFDMHPAAFNVCGPIAKPLNVFPNVLTGIALFGISIAAIAFGSLLGTYMVNHDVITQAFSLGKLMWKTLPMIYETVTSSLYYVSTTAAACATACVSNMIDNWIQVGVTLTAGAIGFGTAARLYQTSEGAHSRERTGTNYVKKMRRLSKGRRVSRRFGSRRKIWVPPNECREHFCATLKHHDRFNCIPRPKRMAPNLTMRIRKTKEEIMSIKTEIKRVERVLKDLQQRLKRREQALKDLERRQAHQTERLTSRRSRKQDKKNKVKDTKYNITRDPYPQSYPIPFEDLHEMKVPFVTRLESTARRCMAAMVNVTDISSSPTDAHESPQVLFDSGANCCVTNDYDDFVSGFKPVHGDQIVDGIGKGLRIAGTGTVAWTFVADNNMYRTLRVPCYYVPTATTRIASVQEILKAYPNETVNMNRNHLTLSGDKRQPPITVPYCPMSNLPMAQTTKGAYAHATDGPVPKRKGRTPKPDLPTKKQSPLTVPSNINLTEPEKELLRWHYRLGHVGMKRIQWLFRQGILSSSEKTRRLHAVAANLTSGPLCTACQYAKQRRKTQPGTIKKTVKEDVNILKQNKLYPGQETSLDHFECNPLGRLLNTYGKEKSDDKYKGGCIMVDSSSGHTHVELQTCFNSIQTLAAVQAYEKVCGTMGVIPQSYLSDKGSSFTSAEFKTHLEQFEQVMRNPMVGAHHSNGIAERNISTVMSIARAQMHHQALHWPDVADVELWPLAVLHAVFILNRIPREDNGLTPLELFTRRSYHQQKIQEFHVWGCPVYVLDNKLADGKKLPRWKPRSTRYMYVGNSSTQGEGVPLVLCLETGSITSQYHVVFDDFFQTVEATANPQVNFEHDDWYKTFGLTEWQYVANEDEPQAVPSQTVDTLEDQLHRQRESVGDVRDRQQPVVPLNDSELPSSPPVLQRETLLQREYDPPLRNLPTVETVTEEDEEAQPVVSPLQEAPPSSHSPPLQRETGPPMGSPQEVVPPQAPTSPPPTRPTRPPPSRPVTRSSYPRRPVTRSQAQAMHTNVEAYFELYNRLYVGKSKAKSDPDSYSWDDAMSSPHREAFLEAAHAEIEALVAKGTWKEVPTTTATSRIIPSLWLMKIKRSPDGEP